MAASTSPVSYEDLAALEDEFEGVDTEIMRKQYELSKSLYAKRAEAVSKIDNFWPLVFEQAPPDIDQWIQPHDSQLINEHLKSVNVTRPELDEHGSAGNPRSVRITLEFSENDSFSDKTLEKTFWYRRASDGWTGMVSEPVKIHWKKGKDMTEGMTDAAVALFEARKKVGDPVAKGVPEYAALASKVEHWNGANTSFFTWFGYVSGRRYVSAEESEKATKEHKAKRDAKTTGDDADGDDAEEDEDDDDQAVEVHEAGEDLAVSIAEDLWPNAIKYFTQAQELGDLSDPEFEEMEEDDEDDDDQPVDIQSLVQGKEKARARDSYGPPAKKVKR